MPEATAPNQDGPSRSQDERSIWARLKRNILWAEGTAVFLKNLSIVGLIGTVIGSYFQYVSWREEQNIARYKEDFAAATATFADTSRTLSAAMNLQQIVYFTFKNAVNADVDTKDDAFLTKSGREIYKGYADARNSLREDIDAVAGKMEIYLDWPSDRSREPGLKISGDPLNGNSIGGYDFDCDKYLPDYRSIDTLTAISIPKPNAQPLQVDWRSTKHHVVTFQYCFERVHSSILVAREWASRSAVDPAAKEKIIRNEDRIQASLDRMVERLHAFMTLAMWRIEDIRLRYQTKGYFCHLAPIARWCS